MFNLNFKFNFNLFSRMRILIFSICLSIVGCSKNNCGELSFDKSKKITYLNNQLYSGDCESFFYTGQLKSEESYKNGKDHGDWVFYFINGSIQTKGTFREGLRIGDWKYYKEDGELWKEHYYSENGNKIGIWKEYDKEGDLLRQIDYKN